MRVLQIGSDRSKRGILFADSPAFRRQEAYADKFDSLDIIGFSLRSDTAEPTERGKLRIFPTNSSSRANYIFDALRLAETLPRPNVVSAQDPFEIGLVGWAIARRFRVPLHVQVHTDFLSPEYARLSVLNKIRVLVAGFVLRRAARVRVVSERIKESIQKKHQLRATISVLPIFVDVQKFKDALPADNLPEDVARAPCKLLIVSRNAPEKNISLAIESFKKVAPKDACLIVAGDYAETKRLDDRVYGVAGSNVERFYKSADLVLMPSRYEGYGLVIVEALAAGKPVLSTDVGVAREAGAIVTSKEKFAESLADWFKSGPRTGELKDYPYKSFDEYVNAYTDDIKACV